LLKKLNMIKKINLYLILKILIIWLLFIYQLPLSGQNLTDSNKTRKKDTSKVLISTNKTKGFVSIDSVKANVKDSSSLKRSPSLAALLSLALPGAGQTYNKKFWKIPIVYGTFATLYFLSERNNRQYHRYLTAYIAVTDTSKATVDEFNGLYPATSLASAKDYYRRNRDLTYIIFGLSWFANVLDAAVDAYMVNYDIGDNLTLRMRPVVLPAFAYGNYFGIKLELKF
jgi:hypothetical protein